MPNGSEIISTEASSYLAKKLARELDIPQRRVARRLFSNGERYYRVDLDARTDLVGADVIVVGSTHTDDDLLELYRIGCALTYFGVHKRTFVIPFFGYSTMERATLPGEIATAKTNARLLSAIPTSGAGNTFMLLDLHTPGLVHYFEGESVCLELSAEDILADAIAGLRLNNFVMASADLGMPVAVQRLAQRFRADIALVSKTRSFEDTKVVAVIGDVKNRDVVIYDDMVRSGSSLLQAAAAYKKQGAKRVFAVISHLALNTPGVAGKLERSVLTKIITTNSHPMSQHPAVKKARKIVIKDIASVFAEAIK